MRKRLEAILATMIFAVMLVGGKDLPDYTHDTVQAREVVEEQITNVHVRTIVVKIEEKEDILEVSMPEEDVRLIALVTMAEAEGESEYGKRLVIDTILNRIDSGYFPDTAKEVIYQPSQFSSMWNGRVDKCSVEDDICELVREEIANRKNSEVIFFTAGKYGNYGVPMFREGNHYFASYE